MFDGSTLSYEENIRQTREVVKMCHAVGVSVEAELVPSVAMKAERSTDHADEAYYTDPQLAREFVDSTGIDALAVAIGNAHGKYKGSQSLISCLTPFASRPACHWCCTAAPGSAMLIFVAPLNLAFHKINFSIPACPRPRFPPLSSVWPTASRCTMSLPSCCWA